MTKRSDAKAATRALVLKTARACFEELGYEGADIRTMAATMGMSTGAVFSNFASKSHLYREVYGHAPISPEVGRELREALIALRAAVAVNSSMQVGKFNDLRIQVNAALAKAA